MDESIWGGELFQSVVYNSVLNISEKDYKGGKILRQNMEGILSNVILSNVQGSGYPGLLRLHKNLHGGYNSHMKTRFLSRTSPLSESKYYFLNREIKVFYLGKR